MPMLGWTLCAALLLRWLAGPFPDPAGCGEWFASVTPWTLPVTWLWLARALLSGWRTRHQCAEAATAVGGPPAGESAPAVGGGWRALGARAAWAVVLVGANVLAVPAAVRLVTDETSLVNVSQGIRWVGRAVRPLSVIFLPCGGQEREPDERDGSRPGPGEAAESAGVGDPLAGLADAGGPSPAGCPRLPVILYAPPSVRPAGFPWLLAVLHGWCGERLENAFWLNSLAAGLAVVWFGGLLVRWLPAWCSWPGMALLAWHPLFVLWQRGGGFETVNLALILATLLVFDRWWRMREPCCGEAAVLLALLAGQIRYETAVLSVVVAVVVFAGTRSKKHIEKTNSDLTATATTVRDRLETGAAVDARPHERPHAMSVSREATGRPSAGLLPVNGPPSSPPLGLVALACAWPVLALPIGWLSIAMLEWHRQLAGHDLAGAAPFAVDRIANNLGAAWALLAGRPDGVPSLPGLGWLALAGLLGFSSASARGVRWREPGWRGFLGVTGLVAAVAAVACAGWGWTEFRDPAMARLLIVFLPAVIAAALGCLAWIGAVVPSARRWLVVAVLIALMAVRPLAMREEGAATLHVLQAYRAHLAWLRARHPDRRALVVSERSGMYVADRFSAVAFAHVSSAVPLIRAALAAGSVTAVYIEQQLASQSLVPRETQRLPIAVESVDVHRLPGDGFGPWVLRRVVHASGVPELERWHASWGVEPLIRARSHDRARFDDGAGVAGGAGS